MGREVLKNRPVFISNEEPANVPLVIQANPKVAQTGDFLQVKNHAGTVLAKISASGVVYAYDSAAGSAQPVVSGSWIGIAREPDLLITGTITRNANGAVTSAPVLWPDGTTGVFTGTASAAFPGAVDAYTVTKGSQTFTQPTMTRDSNGAVTIRPAITVS